MREVRAVEDCPPTIFGDSHQTRRMNTFAELGLSQPLVETLLKMDFHTPTPIQLHTIPKLLKENTDLVGLANTGTGKTAAFGLPLIDLIDIRNTQPQALVLAPTRELCLQICREMKSFSAHLSGLKVQAVYGGADIQTQIRGLKRGAQLVVATPGRLRDLIGRRAIELDTIRYVVLDEADEMLNMGFKEELDDILQHLPATRNTWLFSATMPKEVRRISTDYMNNPEEVSLQEEQKVNVDISHQYVVTRPNERYNVLRRYLDMDPDTFGIVFTRTRLDASSLADQLMKDGYTADALHGDLSQSQRDRVMEKFRNHQIKLLVATDVAARGLDVPRISHIFHFNIPDDRSFYTHRSGRTGRAGEKGLSLVFAHPNDRRILRELEKKLDMKFEQAHIPTGEEILQDRLKIQFRKLSLAEINPAIEPFMDELEMELTGLSREDIISKLASISLRQLLRSYGGDAPDLNRKDKERRRTERDTPMHRLFINVGRLEVSDKGGFLAFICDQTGITGSSIGRIDLQEKFTHFDVEKSVIDQVTSKLNRRKFQGREVRVNDADAGERFAGKKVKKEKKERRRKVYRK
ncbi:MAG: DEAD/DEAH box helicase [Saprospiraceae bacterium]|nr:DEAD/DEAH box helicase [Saprospiraceae bacterium]